MDHYLEYGRRPGRTMRMLGYPKSKELLMAWIDELAPGRRRLRHGPVPEELKREAVVAVASGRSESREAAAEPGVEASVVGNWKRQMLAESKETHVTKERKGKARNGRVGARPAGPDAPAARGTRPVRRTRWRRWKGGWRRRGPVWTSWAPASSGSGGRRGNWTSRSRSGRARWSCREKSRAQTRKSPANREKTLLVKTVSETLGVTARSLLPVVGIARSTYHYQLNAMKRPDKDAWLLPLVEEAFENSKRRYGYKRIHLELKGMGVRVSAKRVMRLTAGHGLAPLFRSAKRYGSYKGELTKAPANLVNRDFHAERPNMLWVTDLTEFSIPAGKACLSPVIDCYDGLPVAWTIGTSPNAALANGMPADACSTLGDGEKPIIHSDCGCHYDNVRIPAHFRFCSSLRC